MEIKEKILIGIILVLIIGIVVSNVEHELKENQYVKEIEFLEYRYNRRIDQSIEKDLTISNLRERASICEDLYEVSNNLTIRLNQWQTIYGFESNECYFVDDKVFCIRYER